LRNLVRGQNLTAAQRARDPQAGHNAKKHLHDSHLTQRRNHRCKEKRACPRVANAGSDLI
jgi:hypothetical protein